jgi:hypothetical protein
MDQELLRFTPRLLTPQQMAQMVDLVATWHSVYVDVVGDGQLGVLGPEQRHGAILRQASNGAAL